MSVINDTFNIEELNYAIDSSKCTTPGKDGISNEIIKHLPIKIREYLLIFNIIWYTSQCPPKWKAGWICALYKSLLLLLLLLLLLAAILIPFFKTRQRPHQPWIV